MFCDVRFSTANAAFMSSFAKRGLVVEDGLSWLLPRIIGQSRAMDVLLSARAIGGIEALEMGLVSKVVEDDQLLVHAISYAQELAKNCSPRSMAVIKRQVWDDQEKTYDDAFKHSVRLLRTAFTTADFREGIDHYVERRPAQFPSLQS